MRWNPLRKVKRPRLRPSDATVASAAFVVGLLLVAVGVGMIHVAIGVIVLGIELATTAILYVRNGRDDDAR